MMKIISGHQPVYLPWLGLFHKLHLADVFVFMDDVQYLTQDWNNRNRIKGPHGAFWLTVPVARGSSSRLLRDVRIVEQRWPHRSHWQFEHWNSLQSCYRRAPYWHVYAPFFESLYTRRPWRWLTALNAAVLRYLIEALDISTRLIIASEADFSGRKSDLVLDHCRRYGAELCVLGGHGREYIIERDFEAAGVATHYQEYAHPSYPQRFGSFEAQLSVVDLLMNCGPESRQILLRDNPTREDLARAAVGAPG
jgi:hypothetical protein